MTWRLGPDGLIDDPREAFRLIVAAIQTADDDELANLGVGPLESLLFDHEAELWDDIEALARSDEAFRLALSFVWAYDSEKYEARVALLFELGEWNQVQVRFVTYRRWRDADAPLQHRALEIDGLAPKQVAPLLREIADQIDAGSPSDDDYPTDGVKLIVSSDFDAIRAEIDAAATVVGLAVLAPAGWWEEGDYRSDSGVTVKYRHDPDHDDYEPTVWGCLTAAMPIVWDAILARPDQAQTCRLMLELLSPNRSLRRYTFVDSHRRGRRSARDTRTGIVEAMALIDPARVSDREFDDYMWLGGRWYNPSDEGDSLDDPTGMKS